MLQRAVYRARTAQPNVALDRGLLESLPIHHFCNLLRIEVERIKVYERITRFNAYFGSPGGVLLWLNVPVSMYVMYINT
jgi:hypothetical protein